MSEDQETFFLGRQPIIDREGRLAAYELLFRAGAKGGLDGAGEVQASATVITRAFSALGVEQVLEDRIGFINVGPGLLVSDLLELLPRERVVLDLAEAVRGDPALVERCRELKDAGFRLCLDDYTADDARCDRLFELVDYVKVDVERTADLAGAVAGLRGLPLIRVAERVETRGQADACRELGFELFQGYFFARPVVLTGRRYDATRASLLRLLSLAMQDADAPQIKREFKHSPQLTYNLLRLVNSVAIGRSQRIETIGHAIAVLGVRQLQRWLQLLLFTVGQDSQGPGSPLLLLAAYRARLMELLAQQHLPADRSFHDHAFMAGLLSLVDVALQMPLQEVIAPLHLAQPVERALLAKEGPVGVVLAAVQALERLNFGDAAHLLAGLPGIDMSLLPVAQMEATRWAEDVARERS